MKIKKIKIQAFKSYLDVKDGTFDFSIGSKKTACFVSIYAPNGFGKTSFCDAVDYAITNKIHRYSRIKKLESSNKEEIKFNNVQGERQLLIRNKFADESLETKVVVDVDNRDEPFVSVYKNPRAGQADYKIECEANKDTAFFENAMLYQEAIDSFLRESNAESRFSKFAENDPELLAISNNRTNLILLRRELLKSKKDYENNLHSIEMSIHDLNLKEKDFTTINLHLTELNNCNLDSSLPLLSVHEHFTRDIYDSYNQSLISLSKKLNWQLRDLEIRKTNFTTHLSNLQLYTTYNNERINISYETSNIENAISSINKSGDYRNKKEKLIEKRNFHINEKITLERYKNSIVNYLSIKKQKDKLIFEKNKQENHRETILLKLNLLDSSIRNLDDSITEYRRLKQEHEDSIEVCKNHFIEISSLEEQIKHLDINLISIEKVKSELQKDLLIQESHNKFLTSLHIKKPISKNQLLFIDNLSIIESLISYQDRYQELHTEIISLNNKKSYLNDLLSQTKSFENQLKKLLDNVYILVKDTKQDNCPICGHKYENYVELEKKIISNPLLSKQEKSILNQISTIDEEEVKIKIETEILIRKFNETLVNIKDKSNKIEVELVAQLELTSEKYHSLSIEKQAKNNTILRLKEIVNYNSHDEFTLNKKLVIKEIQDKTDKLTKEINDARLSSLKQKQLFENINKDIINLEENINHQYIRLTQHQDIIDYLEKFHNSVHDENSLTTLICSQLSLAEKNINSIETSLQEIENEISALYITTNLRYIDEPVAELQKLKTICEQKTKSINSQLSEFEFILASLDIKVDDYYNFEITHSILSQEINKTDSTINNLKESEFHASVIVDLMEVLVGSEGLSTLEANLALLQSKTTAAQSLIEDLDQDIINLGRFIENKVDLFFKTDLINQLYQSIDPHPEYKNIRFECNTDEKPKLLIKAETSNGVDCTSPMLSFSSAQINVLALSIFLARALHIKDSNGYPVDCIFIDDPVQSIDSINTLSLIDLFRAIVVKFNKQIIITTHDENFHSLLKKKMPSTMFPSKYLRLVSFGKVAVDSI